MGLDLAYISGQTPLDEDGKYGLLVPTIATRGELDEFEQQNIELAIEWTMRRGFNIEQVLTEAFLKQVHIKMYGKVWSWAGEFRKTNKNIGVDKWQIGTELKILLDDTKYWIEFKELDPEEIAIRFKHRLVSIHCFPNGNGRHSRLIADILIEKIFKRKIFSWGANNLSQQTKLRENYIKALQKADNGDYTVLMAFAMS
jgi:Fic-DOC domain mobile mystery protein B